jgi:hypothetical protein
MAHPSPAGSGQGNARHAKEFTRATHFRHPKFIGSGVHSLRKLTISIVNLDRRIKTALDETRLLILGSQVLFGFLLESVFQNGFEMLSRTSQYLVCAALGLMVLSIGCLIAPSMQHRIIEAGQSTLRLERATSVLAAWSLLPFIASLGLGLFIVFERIFGGAAGVAVGAASAALAGFFWFGLAWLIGVRRRRTMTEESGATPLSTKIEQMLTEARVIIPGCQALLGFQLVAMLTRTFDDLPLDAKIMHAAGLLRHDRNDPADDARRFASTVFRRQRFRAVPASRLSLCDRRIVAAGAGHRR